MTDTAAKQLRRILQVIPEIADGHQHDLDKVAEQAGVDQATLLADLKALVAEKGDEPQFHAVGAHSSEKLDEAVSQKHRNKLRLVGPAEKKAARRAEGFHLRGRGDRTSVV